MPNIIPFKGLRYNLNTKDITSVVSPPYDVISSDEKKDLENKSKYNAVHVELPGQNNEDYLRASELFASWIREEVIIQDKIPSIYLAKHEFSINNKIILGSISGFGQFGPYSSRPGLDQIAQGLSGLMSVTGMPENGPTRVGVPIGDLTAGMMLAQGVLLALLEREKSGEGQWVHTSLLEGLIQIMDLQAARFLMAGEVPKQVGNLHPVYLPTGVFPTSDSSMNIQSPGQVFWKRLSAALGKPELFDEKDFKTPEDRWENKDRLNKEISELTMQKTTAEWVEILNDAGVPCGPIHRVNETFADPQVQHLNMNPELEHPVIGKINVVGQAIKLSRTPQKMRFTTPEIGEHNDEILSELNYSNEDIEKFKQEDII